MSSSGRITRRPTASTFAHRRRRAAIGSRQRWKGFDGTIARRGLMASTRLTRPQIVIYDDEATIRRRADGRIRLRAVSTPSSLRVPRKERVQKRVRLRTKLRDVGIAVLRAIKDSYDVRSA